MTSFSRADDGSAATQRKLLVEALILGWRKVITHMKSHILTGDDGDLLCAALDEVGKTATRSEHFHYYFLALDSINQRSSERTRAAIRSLGNAFLQDVADGTLGLPVPVHRDADGRLFVPAARPDFGLPISSEVAVVEPDRLRPFADEIGKAIDSTWISRPVGGVPVRGETPPIRHELLKYRSSLTTFNEHQKGTSYSAKNLQLLRTGDQSSDTQAIVGGLEAGFALIDATHPIQASEVRALTEYVVLLEGDQFAGGAGIALYGATFLRPTLDWSDLGFADHLVHENSHQLLHAVQKVNRPLLNPDFRGAPSPIRPDPRPLYGSFHATFVFLRLVLFMEAVLKSRLTAWHVEAECRLHRHLLGLLQGLKALTDHGEFSEPGRTELDAWIGIAVELTKRHGFPDERLYSRPIPDYDPVKPEIPVIDI